MTKQKSMSCPKLLVVRRGDTQHATALAVKYDRRIHKDATAPVKMSVKLTSCPRLRSGAARPLAHGR
jgi:hypothetical protein